MKDWIFRRDDGELKGDSFHTRTDGWAGEAKIDLQVLGGFYSCASSAPLTPEIKHHCQHNP